MDAHYRHPEALVTDHVPGVARAAYEDASVRHLLDMRSRP